MYPFGWTLATDESRIKLDWEHTGYEWISPDDVISGKIADECVPRIRESFRRVYFGHGGIFGETSRIRRDSETGKVFVSGIDQLRNDKLNGARILATEAVRSLARIVRTMDEVDWRSLKIAAYHLIYSARPSMNAAISSAVLQALKQACDSSSSSNIADKLDSFIEDREKSSNKICQSFTSFAQEHCKDSNHLSIITLSSSSTIRSSILDLLDHCRNLTITLKILESRPLCEGASLACSILSSAVPSSRLRIQIAPDTHVAMLALSSPAPSLLLLGADRISPSGHVSNKMGSTAAAIVTKQLAPHIKIVVLSETDKIAAPSDLMRYEKGEEDSDREMEEHLPESNDPAEVSRVWAAAGTGEDMVRTLTRPGVSIEIMNVYFEWIPDKYVDVYICEDGPLLREEIRNISLSKAELEKEMFDDLYDNE